MGIKKFFLIDTFSNATIVDIVYVPGLKLEGGSLPLKIIQLSFVKSFGQMDLTVFLATPRFTS